MAHVPLLMSVDGIIGGAVSTSRVSLWQCTYIRIEANLRGVVLYYAGKGVAADSDSDEDSGESVSEAPSRPSPTPELSQPSTTTNNIGGPLSGGLTIPSNTDEPGKITRIYFGRLSGDR